MHTLFAAILLTAWCKVAALGGGIEMKLEDREERKGGGWVA